MATKQVLGPASQVTWNGTDISQYVTNISIDDSREEVDVTGMGETYREFTDGLGDASVSLTVINGTGIDPTLYPSYVNRTAGTLKWKADTAGTVVYTLVGKIYSWPAVAGGPGDAHTVDVSIRNAGTAGLTRGTA